MLFRSPARSALDNPLVAASPFERVLTAIAVQGRYLALQVAPLRLSSDYSYAQLIPVRSPLDPWVLVTLAAASSNEKDGVNGGNLAGAKAIGKLVADRTKAKGIEAVVFDRGGFLYHGRIAALANAAREGGLSF